MQLIPETVKTFLSAHQLQPVGGIKKQGTTVVITNRGIMVTYDHKNNKFTYTSMGEG